MLDNYRSLLIWLYCKVILFIIILCGGSMKISNFFKLAVVFFSITMLASQQKLTMDERSKQIFDEKVKLMEDQIKVALSAGSGPVARMEAITHLQRSVAMSGVGSSLPKDKAVSGLGQIAQVPDSRDVRKKAVEALRIVAADTAQDEPVYIKAVQELGRIALQSQGDPETLLSVIEQLNFIVNQPSVSVKIRYFALGQLGTAARQAQDKKVCIAAIKNLGGIAMDTQHFQGNRKMLERAVVEPGLIPITPNTQGPEVYRAAIEQLGRIGNGSSDDYIRAAAFDELDKIAAQGVDQAVRQQAQGLNPKTMSQKIKSFFS